MAVQSASASGFGVSIEVHRSVQISVRLFKMDVAGERIEITRAEPTDINEICLLSAQASEHNVIIRAMLSTNPQKFDIDARKIFYRWLYSRALGTSKSSNVVFKATDAQGKIVGCIWLQWFHGILRSWIDKTSWSPQSVAPLSLTLPACINKTQYYELLLIQQVHRMDWMESLTQVQGKGHWCTYRLLGIQQVSGAPINHCSSSDLKELAFLPRAENANTLAIQLINHAYAFDTNHGLFAPCTPAAFTRLYHHFKWEFAHDMPFDGIDYQDPYYLKGLIRRGSSTTEDAPITESEAVDADLENLFCGWSKYVCSWSDQSEAGKKRWSRMLGSSEEGEAGRQLEPSPSSSTEEFMP